MSIAVVSIAYDHLQYFSQKLWQLISGSSPAQDRELAGIMLRQSKLLEENEEYE